MSDLATIRERYLRDGLPVRLGGLSANLARIHSFSDRPQHADAVEVLLNESKFFIEWTAPEIGPEFQAELVDLQVQLARWQRSWAAIWADPERRRAVARQARDWSERALKRSGLLP